MYPRKNRVTITIDEELLEQLKEIAKLTGRSVSAEARIAIKNRIIYIRNKSFSNKDNPIAQLYYRYFKDLNESEDEKTMTMKELREIYAKARSQDEDA